MIIMVSVNTPSPIYYEVIMIITLCKYLLKLLVIPTYFITIDSITGNKFIGNIKMEVPRIRNPTISNHHRA